MTSFGDTVINAQKNLSYDEFGRLSAVNTIPNSGTVTNLSFLYDRWGNRWQQNVTAGSAPQPQ